MDYILLHQDYPVVTLSIDDQYHVERIKEVHNKDRLPVALQRAMWGVRDFEDWFFSRGIPQKRRELKVILGTNHVESRNELIIKNKGLGLVDHYWIQNVREQKKWGEVNFFENEFNQKGDDIYIGGHTRNGGRGVSSGKLTPNNVSSGMLPKKWERENGILYLIKGSELHNYQEPFNEVIVSRYLDALRVEHVPYDLKWYKGRPYSSCPHMLGINEELIHAFDIYNMEKKDNKISYLDHYITGCVRLGLDKSIRKDLENMIIIDYVTANTDRHWTNFGIIRDTRTLKAKRIAPLYDNGASFFAKIASMDISDENKRLKSQAFSTSQNNNIRLVQDYELLSRKVIDILPDLIQQGFDKKFVSEDRVALITLKIKQRISRAKKYGTKHTAADVVVGNRANGIR